MQTNRGSKKLVFLEKPEKKEPLFQFDPKIVPESRFYAELDFLVQMRACYNLFSSLFHFYYFFRTSYHYLCKNLSFYVHGLPKSLASKSVKTILLASLDCAPDLCFLTPQYLFDSMFLGTKDGPVLEVVIKQSKEFQDKLVVTKNKKYGYEALIVDTAHNFDAAYREQVVHNPKIKREVSDKFDPVVHLEQYLGPVFFKDPKETPARFRSRQETAFLTTFSRMKGYEPIRVHHRPETMDANIAPVYEALAVRLSDHILDLRARNLGSMLENIKDHMKERKTADIVIPYDQRGQQRLAENMEAAGIYSESECQLVSKSEWVLNNKYREVIEGIRETLKKYKEEKVKRDLTERCEKRLD